MNSGSSISFANISTHLLIIRLSNAGELSWILELNSLAPYPSSERERKFLRKLFYVLNWKWNQSFLRRSLEVTAKECKGKVCCTSWVFVLPIAFLKSLLSPSMRATALKNDVSECIYYVFIWNLIYTTLDLKNVLGFYLAGPISVGGIPDKQI